MLEDIESRPFPQEFGEDPTASTDGTTQGEKTQPPTPPTTPGYEPTMGECPVHPEAADEQRFVLRHQESRQHDDQDVAEHPNDVGRDTVVRRDAEQRELPTGEPSRPGCSTDGQSENTQDSGCVAGEQGGDTTDEHDVSDSVPMDLSGPSRLRGMPTTSRSVDPDTFFAGIDTNVPRYATDVCEGDLREHIRNKR